MNKNYKIFILLLFVSEVMVAMDEGRKRSQSLMQRASSNFKKGFSFSSVSNWLKGKLPKLPKASDNDPHNIKRFSEKPILLNEKRVSMWEDEDLPINTRELSQSLAAYKKKQSDAPRSLAVEYDMARVKPDNLINFVTRINNISQPYMKVDQGQAKVGLLMLYPNQATSMQDKDIKNLKESFFKISEVKAVKEGTEYTQSKEALVSLIENNIAHIDPEILVDFFVQEQGLSLSKILKKLDRHKDLIEKNKNNIERAYTIASIKLEEEQKKIQQDQLNNIPVAYSNNNNNNPTARKTDIKDFSFSSEDWDEE